MNPKPYEIWLIRFPFSDLTSAKVRPALILAVHRQEFIVSGIFSKIPSETIPKTWVLVPEIHPQFSQTGLKKTSLIRGDKIATVDRSIFQIQLGLLPSDLAISVREAIAIALGLSE
ncbi:MAG: type II toxin-antitoxin system PemK/MazF family toxin [Cyanobacteria bacterium P01_E01_bin.42]